MDIFNLAKECSNKIEESYRRLKEECNTADLELLDKFSSFIVDNWRITINMKESDLIRFLINGRYLNIYELAKIEMKEIKDETGNVVSLENVLKSHLKEHYEARITFDNAFEDGVSFKYGALNVGGVGASTYGPYCAVVNRGSSEMYSSLAFIKFDSLRYVSDKVDICTFSEDISCKECIHMFATLKYYSQLKASSYDRWPYIVCCDENYIEVITKDDIVATHLEKIRVDRSENNLYRENILDSYKQAIDRMRKYQLASQRIIREMAAKMGIKLEVCDVD